MPTRSERMIARKSEISKHLTETPDKRRSLRIEKKQNIRETSLPRRQSVRTRGAPIYNPGRISDSSSSDSSDDDDDVIDEHKLESSEDELDIESDCSEEIGEVFDIDCARVSSSSEKENRRRTRSQASCKRFNEETPSKKVARDLKAKCNVATPKKNLSKLNCPVRGNEHTTPRDRVHRASAVRNRAQVFQSSEGEFSDELGDEEVTKRINDSKSRKLRTPIVMKFSKKILEPKVTPLIIEKTPRGTLRTRKCLRRDSEEEHWDHFQSSSSGTNDETLKGLASRLHLSKVPEKLPCRESESRDIEKFIREVIDPKRGESSAMYISGVPGTGKTATVRAVVNSMQKNKKCPRFVYVEVNAMIFKKTVFVEVFNGIQKEYGISKKNRTSVKITATAARQELNAMFKKEDPHRPPIVILIDELDSLCNRKQDVLYDIFEWTASPQSKVTIIGIANTLDFPERMLCQRNASRLDKRRLVFQPYEHKQIQEIVSARLQGSKLIEPTAVELVAKKVAMNTGDLRQALDFLCRAIQVAVEQSSEKLELRHVIAAQNAVLEPLKYRLVKGLRLHQFTLFRAVEAMTREQEEVIFSSVYKTYSKLCTDISGIQPASESFTYNMLLQLATAALVTLPKCGHGTVNRRIKLGMSSMEAEKAVKMYIEKHKLTYSI